MTVPITITKSYSDGKVTVRVTLRIRGYNEESINMQGNTTLSTVEARSLATSLVAFAAAADAKVAKKAAEEDRRKKWRDREIAAGRMKIMSWRE